MAEAPFWMNPNFWRNQVPADAEIALHPSTPWKARLAMVAAVLYVISPYDILTEERLKRFGLGKLATAILARVDDVAVFRMGEQAMRELADKETVARIDAKHGLANPTETESRDGGTNEVKTDKASVQW